MRREDATPFDGPACRWCGRDVETDDTLCAECVAERSEAQAEESADARHEALLAERRGVVGTEA